MQKRKIERKGFCRGCDKVINNGEEIIYTYSHRNRGQSIIFCLTCAEMIGKLVQDNLDEHEEYFRRM